MIPIIFAIYYNEILEMNACWKEYIIVITW